MATPPVLVFDVNETLLDIESIAPLFGELFGDERVLREWFAQLVMYSMSITLAGNYVTFPVLAQGVLRMLGDIYQVDVTDERSGPPEDRAAHHAGTPRCRRRACRAA